ncbi:NACHT, LRR and PYD domains-containing protein 3-like [Labrus mixtus]|uniref:NACHT, LRR and PYD domains-containing protein 3-like n=1 Tax=Labrus mixtus TaxID=508554 RepID=UPI0029C0A7E2|nr:NACHT, LRR and PYD domains-containing protein 3-like [Labrus mixtus]
MESEDITTVSRDRPKMSFGEQHEEDRAGSPVSTCLSPKSDHSKDVPLTFSNEPGLFDTKPKMRSGRTHEEDRADSPVSTCLSPKSDHSKDVPLTFSNEPGLFAAKERKRTYAAIENELPCCALCKEVVRPSQYTSCGHYICKQCIASHWEDCNSTGDPPCPQCGKRCNYSRIEQGTGSMQEVLDTHRISLRRRCEFAIEGTAERGTCIHLNSIYTELYITEGQSEGVNIQHEVWQLETLSKNENLCETPIKCHDIFKVLPGQRGFIRVVLTNGIAGIGKTFSVKKFTLDWAQGLENQDVSLVILLSFRELNLIKEYSLLRLLHDFHPTLRMVTAQMLAFCKVLFIFDGLDESRLLLDFQNKELVSDVNQKSSVNLLLTNLITGSLLPSALLWITSRPAAANQIPPSYIDRMTEVRGFTDTQKEEYFRKRFSDESMSSRVVSHIKAFYCICRLSCSGLSEWHCEVLSSALMSNPSHLRELDLSENDYLLDSGVTSLCVGLKSPNCRLEILSLKSCSLSESCCESLASALKSTSSCLRELDLSNNYFKDSGVKMLSTGLESPHCRLETLRLSCCRLSDISCGHLVSAIKSNPSHMKEIDLSKNKIKDRGVIVMSSALESPQCELKLLRIDRCGLTVDCCTALSSALKSNPSCLRELELSNNDLQDSGVKLLCAGLQSQHCRLEALRLRGCWLSDNCCASLASALTSNSSSLRELDLCDNDLQDSGIKQLSVGLERTYCRLETLRLIRCKITGEGCAFLAAALKSNPSHLQELDLSRNNLQESDVKPLSEVLKSPHCRLETLRMEEIE